MAAPEIPVSRLEPWSFNDLFELPESVWRFEIVDGALLMTPPAGIWHEGICATWTSGETAQLSHPFEIQLPIAELER